MSAAKPRRDGGIGDTVAAHLTGEHRGDAGVARLVRAGHREARLDPPVGVGDADGRLRVVDESTVADGHVGGFVGEADRQSLGGVSAHGVAGLTRRARDQRGILGRDGDLLGRDVV